jgi:hypothetical protein
MVMPARWRLLTVVCGLALLVGGLVALVGVFMPWALDFYPLDYRVPGSPPDPEQPIYHSYPLGNVLLIFHNATVNRSASGFGAGLACGAVFLAPPLVLMVVGLLVCATRRWRATSFIGTTAGAGLVATLSIAWLYAHPCLGDSGRWHRPDAGAALTAFGYGCALVAGIVGGLLRLDHWPVSV